ncbi:8-oxoguanine DNA glycosylase OGG fold protein [Arthrobacter sp. FW306-06-A]|uniref:8-oxoguanine DNA glycosylase OGG fold protein n=1 Tax=Arthrobacter sp. FW306-06-A TaxID=2879621 RepID=UPI001F3EF371|nr:hypothetical protein [Arthrobacter sp. FW306-06-A]UKA73520.1 hypothetical protein LFT49_22255 [Arthrobacter sp. FW306-06-A]
MIILSSPLPEPVYEALSTPAVVLDHRVNVNSDRWQKVLSDKGLVPAEGKLASGGRITISRQEVFALGQQTPSPARAMQLLYHSLAWGLGLPGSWLHRRLDGLAKDPTQTAALLENAWSAIQAGEPAREAYSILTTPRGTGRVSQLGPAFGTKFLYFSQGSKVMPNHLILDRVVAGRLKSLDVWPDARNDSWGPSIYGAYCQLLNQWAAEATQRAEADSPVRADQIEHTLFKLKL